MAKKFIKRKELKFGGIMNKKLILSFGIILVLASAGVVSASLVIIFAGGDGSIGNPYQISTCVDLQDMKNNLSANYILVNDVDCSDTINWNGGAGFEPVGTPTIVSRFTGTFDGQNHTITGLFINRGNNSVGLFGYITASASISNVGLEDVNIIGHRDVGGLVGFNQEGTITNSYATGSVSGREIVGGLVGQNWGTIINSYANGSSFSSTMTIGGLVGDNSGFIDNSYSTGIVFGGGGFIGTMGGLVGDNSGFIDNSYSTGSVFGREVTGGLVGATSGGTITNSYSTGIVSGGGFVGGLVGATSGGTITNSYSTGSVSGSDSVGGLVGYNNGTITNSYSNGSVFGFGSFVGGLVGQNYLGTIINSYSTGSVFGFGSFFVGGLVGYNNGTITNSYWDTQTSGQSTSDGGVGKTTAQMMQQTTFVGWDFVDVWGIFEGLSYPFLLWQTPLVVDSDGDGILDVDDSCPLEDATGLDVNLDGCIDTVGTLIDETQSLNLKQGISNSLDAKLQNAKDAQDAANAGQRQDAINKLQSFINAVEAQRNKAITNEQADILIALTNNIIAQI